MAQPDSTDYNLIIRQHPHHAKVAIGKEKDRKPIDPPPIVQLKITGARDATFLQSPYFFMSANLIKSNGNEIQPAPIADVSTSLAGTLVSSLHRLKDTDNSDGGFFVFFDLSVKVEGNFRLQFNLYEMRAATSIPDETTIITSTHPLSQYLISQPREVYLITTTTSAEFKVHAARTWPGMGESTLLTRSFSEQGVKLRLRKEPRTLLRKRGPASDNYEPKTYRTKVGRSGEEGMQTQRRASLQRSDSPVLAFRRTSSPIQQRTASRMANTGSELFQDPQNAYGQPPRQLSDPNFSQRFDTSDPHSPLHEPGSPTTMPIHTRGANLAPSLLSSHHESSDMSSLSSTAVTRAEEFGGGMPRRSLSIAQLRQASSDSSLRSQSQSHTSTGIPFAGVPENSFLPSTSLPGSNRTSFSELSGSYTHQPPTQTMHPSLHRTPQSYGTNYGQHNYSRSQSSLASHSPVTSRSTPQSIYSFGAGPRDAHTGMVSSAMTSPFESPEAGRRDYGSWASEVGEDRMSLPNRGQDPNSTANFSTPTPFYAQRHGSYGQYGRPLPISQAQGLGITGLYNPASNYMPAPALIPSNSNELLAPLSGGMASASGAQIEASQVVSSSDRQRQAVDSLGSSVGGAGDEVRGRDVW